MNNEKKTYFITDDRFKWISLLLIFIFVCFMGVVVWQGENISRDPCSICSERMGENVICTKGLITKSYFPNGSIGIEDRSENSGGDIDEFILQLDR